MVQSLLAFNLSEPKYVFIIVAALVVIAIVALLISYAVNAKRNKSNDADEPITQITLQDQFSEEDSINAAKKEEQRLKRNAYQREYYARKKAEKSQIDNVKVKKNSSKNTKSKK